MLAAILDRDGQQHSATQTRQQSLADADHLALLHAIWTAETTPARQQRYRDLLMAALPAEHRDAPGHQARWLFRTLRSAELAGLDPAQVLADAIAERDLAGSRDISAVLDNRIRSRLGTQVPLPPGPWSAQVPAIADPERHAYVTEIAALMDARKDRIGEHAAEHSLPWAVAALGPVPDHPVDRLDWQKRAASIGAWRELSGYQHPADPIGPEPAIAAPDLRAAWHEAFAALGPVDGPDVRGLPDGILLHLRDTYPTETAWAPQYVGDELRQVRAAAWTAHLAALRASAEAEAAASRGQHDRATQQQDLAASYQALHQAYQHRETIFAAIMADRADWDTATRAQRHLAVTADAELRRRHPGQHHPPLRSAEPPPASAAQRAELTLTTGQPPGEIGQWIQDLTAAHRTFAGTLAERQSLALPSDDPDYQDLGPAFPPWPGPAKDAILQPPRPEITPSPQVMQRAADRDADLEAADLQWPGSSWDQEGTTMTALAITGMGLTGVLRLASVNDNLAHVLEHCEADEPSGTWTGLAGPRYGLPLGADVDNAVLRQLADGSELADLLWEAPDLLVGEHAQVFQAAMRAYSAGDAERAEQLWEALQAIWSHAWSANYAVLELMQGTGLTRFSPVKPQQWVVASFEHHTSPHGLPHPHVHNIVIGGLTTGPGRFTRLRTRLSG